MQSRSTFLDAERETRLFFWFMTLIMAGMFVLVVATQPELRQPLRLVVFTVLMNVHIILHWMLRNFATRPGWTVGYMLVQGILALILVLISHNTGLAFTVFMALIGEAIGVYGITKRGFFASAYYLLMSLGSYVYLFGVEQLGWWTLAVIPMFIFVVIYVELYSRQMYANERARELLAELETANRQLSEYAAQVEDLTIAAERQRMARELHDTLSQGLAGLILQLEAADAHLGQDHPDKARQIVRQTMDQARVTLGEARRAIDDLRRGAAPILEEAIQKEVERFTTSSGVPCKLEINLPVELPPAQHEAIVRIVPEALNNIQRHASASLAWVRLEAGEGGAQLEIGDNGVSFEPESTPPGHYGLIGIRERARLAGGELEILSRAGTGTRLVARFPQTEPQP